MSETTELNKTEDDYADETICERCHLPKLVTTYELGFRLMQQQLIDLRREMQALVSKIDTLDKRNVS